jgi:hypothetical protein
MKRHVAAARLRARLGSARGMGFTGKQFESNIKAIEVVRAKGCLQNAPNLVVIASRFEFFRGSTDGKIVDENLALFEGALSDATEFTQFEIAEALDADPDTDSKHSENQAQRAARRPEQKQAEHGEHGGDSVKHNYDLAMSEAVLQQLVMDMLAIGSKYGAAADQAPENGKRGFENRQAEGNHGNGNCNNGGSFLGTSES